MVHEGLEKKIAAIGVRVQKWVTFHGVALNINPDLEYFKRIVPCGIDNFGVTSLREMEVNVSLEEVDEVLKQKFYKVFGDV